MTTRMTKYELSRIIGTRASQIAMSAPLLIDVPECQQLNFMYIAAMELKHGKLDIVIRRPLPNNRYYEVSVTDMSMPDDLDMLIAMYQNH